MVNSFQQNMFQEMKHKEIFNQAQRYAFDYADSTLERPVFPTDEAIENLSVFVEDLPDEIGEAGAIIEKLHQYGSPATTAATGGRYFGFVTGGAVPAALAVRWLTDFWDQNSALYAMSPISSTLEAVVETWLIDLLGLPAQTVAGFVSGSSLAIFCSLAAARYRILQNNGWDINQQGLNGAPKIRVVTGHQTHGTVVKAIALLGLGTDSIEWTATDSQGRIIPDRLPQLDANTILVLQAGQVSTGAFDPFNEICQLASKASAWVHVDGAFGLWAAGTQKLRHLTQGIEKAHSWSGDGHKTLNTPYDSGIVLCRDKAALSHALHTSGPYMTYSEHREGMLYTPEMSRRSRAIELWATLKYLGKTGVDELVYGLHQKAVQISKALSNKGFHVLNDVVFNQVLVTCDSDKATLATMNSIQKSGECWVGGTTWEGKAAIRISICSWATTEADIERSVRAFVTARNKL